jgi:hypothetical protein
MDDFFGSSNTGNATSNDESLDEALINLVPIPNDIQGGRDEETSTPSSDVSDPFGF